MTTLALCVFSFSAPSQWHTEFQLILAAYNVVYASPTGIPVDHTCM